MQDWPNFVQIQAAFLTIIRLLGISFATMKTPNQCRLAFQSTLFVFFVLVVLLISQYSHAQIHFDMNIELTPAIKTIKNNIKISASKNKQPLQFFFNKNLTVKLLSNDDKIILLQPAKPNEVSQLWELQFGAYDDQVEMQIVGILDSIQLSGIQLNPQDFWLPTLSQELFTFNLKAELPLNWRAMTSGQVTEWKNGPYTSTISFKQIYPQQDLHLIAGEYHVTSSSKSEMWTKTSMLELTEKYLKMSDQYLERYSQLIGPYPYQSMTIIEDDSDMGLGYPGYTTLGSQVLRLPFILNSSLPHEILHNWFGNSIYPDQNTGNWAEGLTTYLADHYEKTLINQDKEYRLNTLIGFQDFVKPENEMSLNEFRGRYNEASQAIGYGKSLMFFHMIKTSIGQSQFNNCIQEFYKQKQFKFASYNDILQICSATSKKIDLTEQLSPFLYQKGMIEFKLESAHLTENQKGFQVILNLQQLQDFKYSLDVPIKIFKDQNQYVIKNFTLKKDSNEYSIPIEFRAVKVEIDPEYDVFRKLDNLERPVTLSKVFASKKLHIYSDNETQLKMFLAGFRFQNNNIQLVFHKTEELSQLPIKEDILVFGASEQILNLVKDTAIHNDFKIKNNEIIYQDQAYSISTQSFTLTLRGKVDPEQTIWWISLPKNADESLFARKIQHYTKKSLLIFDNQMTNLVQSQWSSSISPLNKTLELIDAKVAKK